MSNKQLIKQVHQDIWLPALSYLPEKWNTREAAVLSLTIGLQESRLVHRYQLVAGKPGAKGPARGLWQFEKGGGVKGVLTHRASAALAKEILVKRGYPATVEAAFEAIEKDDIVAAAFARLLMYTDPFNLPEVGQKQRAWNMYERVWRPGKPHRQTWDGFYDEVVDTI